MRLRNGQETVYNGLTVSGSTSLTGSLSLSGSATLQGNLTTNLTAGSIPFIGTSGVISQNNSSLFWDNTNQQLQVITSNTASAQRGLSVTQYSDFIGGAPISFNKARGTSASPTNANALDIIGAFTFNSRVAGAYTVDRGLFGANMATSTGIGIFIIGGTADGTYNPGIYVHPSNNVTIGSSQSILTGITDSGYKLLVSGSGPSGSLNADNTLYVSGSNVGIGVANPSSYKLDVNGTARVQDSLLVSKNQNFTTLATVSNTTSGTASQTQVSITSDTSSGTGYIVKTSSTRIAYKMLSSKDFYLLNGGTAGDIGILNDYASGIIKLAAGGSSTAQATLFSTGNLAIGSTTDSGHKLLVSGSGISGSLNANNVLIVSGSSAQITGSLNISGSITITSGSVTMPNRPAFRVTGAGGGKAAVTPLTGSYLNVDYQQGSGWDNSTGTFTAPIAGLYQVNLIVRTNSNSLGTISQLIVYKNNTGGTTGTVQIMIEFGANTTMNHAGGSTISQLAAGDTLKMVVASGEISFDVNDNFSVAYIG